MSKVCYHTKKSIFDNRRNAETFIANLDKIKNENKMLRAYFCEYCGGYHLTKTAEAINKAIHLKHYKDFKKYIQQ